MKHPLEQRWIKFTIFDLIHGVGLMENFVFALRFSLGSWALTDIIKKEHLLMHVTGVSEALIYCRNCERVRTQNTSDDELPKLNFPLPHCFRPFSSPRLILFIVLWMFKQINIVFLLFIVQIIFMLLSLSPRLAFVAVVPLSADSFRNFVLLCKNAGKVNFFPSRHGISRRLLRHSWLVCRKKRSEFLLSSFAISLLDSSLIKKFLISMMAGFCSSLRLSCMSVHRPFFCFISDASSYIVNDDDNQTKGGCCMLLWITVEGNFIYIFSYQLVLALDGKSNNRLMHGGVPFKIDWLWAIQFYNFTFSSTVVV